MKVILTISEEVTHIRYNTRKDVTQITTRGEIDNHGVCRVSYSKNEYNEFEFDGKEDFRQKFKPCVERDLLRFLGVI
jgi:hypothetical protein